MGAFAYCDRCSQPLPNPTLSDAVVGNIRCVGCDYGYDLDECIRRTVVEDLQDNWETTNNAD